MLRLFVVVFMFVSYAFGSDKYMKELESLSKDQLAVLYYTINKGKEEGVGYALAAIAWKESGLGKWKMNLDDGKYGSFSLYHINLEYHLSRNKIKNTSWNRSRTAEALMDDDKATDEVVELLKYWVKYHKVSDASNRKVFASYNGGYKPNKQANNYADDAVARMNAIEKFSKKQTMDIANK